MLHKLVELLAHQIPVNGRECILFQKINYFFVYGLNRPLCVSEAVNRLLIMPRK